MSDPFATFRKTRQLLERAGNAGNEGNSLETAHSFSNLPRSPTADGHGEQGNRAGADRSVTSQERSADDGRPATIDPEDWLAVYDERAAIREFDGHLPRDAAEALAHEDAVAALGPRPEMRASPSPAETRPEVCSPCSLASRGVPLRGAVSQGSGTTSGFVSVPLVPHAPCADRQRRN